MPLAYDAIYRRLEEGIDSLATSSLSISLWALGATHHPCTSFLAASEAAVVSNLSYFTTQGLADVASSYARLGYSCPELMERLAEVSAARIVQFNDRELANLMWAFAVAGYKAPKLFAAGQSAAAARAAEMHVQDLTTITWASVKTGSQSLPCFAAMAVHLETRAGEMTPRDIANAAWSFAIAGIRDAELFSALEEASLNQVDAFCPQSASSTLYSFAKASRKAPRLFSKMERRVKEQLEASTPQGIANSLWAYARNGHKAPGLFSAVTAHILKERPGGAGAFNAQEISNIAWACAKLRFEAPGLLEALADRAADLAGSLTPQGISNTMWALAKGGMREQGAAVKLAAEARSRVGDFTELELSNVLWAAGQLLRWGGNQECSNVMEELFAAAEEHIIRDLRRDDFNTVALTIAIQAYARAGQPATRLCDAVEQAVSLGAARFPPRDLSSIAWSFGKLNERAPMMFRAIARNARGCPLAWEPRHLATVMWGCGRLRYSLPGLLLVIEDALVNRRDQFSTQALSNLAQACAQLGIRSEVVLKSVEEEVMGREDGSFRKKELESIAWAYRKLGAGDEKFFEHICQQQKIRRWHHRESREGAGGS